ncbi:MAG: extensin family protein [Acidobacteriota bacterium]
MTVYLYFAYAPDAYNLARPLDVNHRPTLINALKLEFGGIERCYQALERSGIEVERLPDEVKGEGCGFEDVARLDASFISWGGGITLTCPMLVGLAWWERHTLQPVAEDLLGSQIMRVRHFGTYSCRNINNAPTGRRSQHATANAVDVAGFVLADGREISVLKHWGEKTPEGRFLERVHDRACKHFDTVLGPDYNELHRDHFHFDNGGYETCR